MEQTDQLIPVRVNGKDDRRHIQVRSRDCVTFYRGIPALFHYNYPIFDIKVSFKM